MYASPVDAPPGKFPTVATVPLTLRPAPVAPVGPCGPVTPCGPCGPVTPCGPCGPSTPFAPLGPCGP